MRRVYWVCNWLDCGTDDMTTLSKDEVVKMASEAGAAPEDGVSGFWVAQTEDLQRFATLCRAPLVAENAVLKQAHEINADTLNAMQVEIDDWKARALKAERVGEPVAYIAWKDGKPCYEGDDAICEDAVWPVDSDDDRTSMPVCTAPQPAAQEPDCATTGVCVRSGLYASPPSAVPVVEKLVEALSLPCDRWNRRQFEITRAAIAAGQKFIKENGK